MKTIMRAASSMVLVMGAILCILISKSQAAEWTIAKTSGAVWIENSGVQQVSLSSGSQLNGGDQIKTGPNGRVMLVRGEETILVSPNSAIALPKSASAGLKTTILQQAGSILLSVEKRNVKHFEVQTPFLAAVVKGTKFAVNVTPNGTQVNVTEGRVEVADFRSGQIALVLPGQSALVSPNGRPGLSLSGSGKFEAIRQGSPRAPRIKALKVPTGGFANPRGKAVGRSASVSPPGLAGKTGGRLEKANGRVRINAAIGEVRVNFAKATNGLARSSEARHGGNSDKNKGKGKVATVWADGQSGGSTGGGNNGNGIGLALGLGNGNGNGNGNGLGLGLGNGNGNGNGLGLGLGNGNGLGVGGCPPGLAKKGLC